VPIATLQGSPDQPLYRRVADRVAGLISGGTLLPGERIPSVRRLSRQLSVSVTTVLEAYRVLEDRGIVEVRPQSGYYVKTTAEPPPEPDASATGDDATFLEIGELVLRLVREGGEPDLVPFGAAVPSAEFLPTASLNRILARVARGEAHVSQSYDPLPGYEALRVQIARRALDAGCSLKPADLVITSGAQEAVALCLQSITRPGDTVALESPTYYGLLEILESLHLRALEIATDPRDGIRLDELEKALARGPIAAVALIPSFGNPLGHCMSEASREKVVAMLADAGVPLIEDDIYGELPFANERLKACKAFDRDGLVLLCSSFSKTLAPGYRVGWTAPGRFRRSVERHKFAMSIANATPTQMAVAEYLATGGFDRHLRRLRRTYRDLISRITLGIGEHFPDGTRVTRPAGGHVVWVELPRRVDSLRLHEEALEVGISIAPGPLFSASGRYSNFMRLNCAVPWSDRVHEALKRLGELARR
jgi:DNA-binding transcriptional MocR family regulator